MKILVFDNYDSFTYNLVHIIRQLGYGAQMDIYRNDQIALEDIAKYDKILLSPGPGIPSEAGILLDVIKTYATSKDILGVCLGHQAIAEAFGGEIYNMDEVLHGVAETISVTAADDRLFTNLPPNFMACRYHSWSVSPDKLPAELEVTALDQRGQIMALRHKNLKISGVQFHPESIMTEHGIEMIKNWLTSE